MRCSQLDLRPVRLAFYTVLLAIFLASPNAANATIHITSVTGVSNVTGLATGSPGSGTGTTTVGATPTPTPTPTTVAAGGTAVVIYGGMAGADPTGGSSSALGDSCAIAAGTTLDAGLIPCNKTRINPNLYVNITYYSDSITQPSYPLALDYIKSGNVTIQNGVGSTQVSANTLVTVSIAWSAICTAMASGGVNTCPDNNGTFNIGFSALGGTFAASDDVVSVSVIVSSGDTSGATSLHGDCNSAQATYNANNAGVCHYELNSGDGGATIKNIIAASSFPSANGTQISELHFLYVTGTQASPPDPTQINAASPYFTVPVGSASSSTSVNLQSDRIDGLNNDTLYWFKVASVDLAGNIGYYTQQALDSGPVGCTQYYSTLTPMNTSCHAVLPGAIDGILTNSPSCFIATAAYGSPMNERVNTFRSFRDRFLIHTAWTRKLVSLYYRYSPEYARRLAKSDFARAVARGFLWPVWAFAWVALQIGLSQAFVLLITLFLLPLVLLKRKQFALRQWRS